MLFGAFFAVYYGLVIGLDIITDIQQHVGMLQQYVAAGRLPMPPLYYGVLHFVGTITALGPSMAAPMVLGFAAMLKFRVVENELGSKHATVGSFAIPALTLALLVAAPLFLAGPYSRWYLGAFSTAVHHNSTTLFALPFSLLLHFRSLRYIRTGSRSEIVRMVLLALVVLLIKPSYLFAQLPVFPLLVLLERDRPAGVLTGAFVYTVIVALMLLGMHGIVYEMAMDDLQYPGERASVVLAPFKVWLQWTSTPLMRALASVAFVLACLIRDPRVVLRSLPVRYALILFLVAAAIFILIAESGPRQEHGNFYWQVPIALLVLHIALVQDLVDRNWPGPIAQWRTLPWRDKLPLAVGLLQVLCGVLYAARLLIFGTYL